MLNLKAHATQGEVRLFTLAAAARALGISPLTLKALERQQIVAPKYAADTRRSPMRVFTDADLQAVIRYYAAKGGPRKLPMRQP